MRTETQESRAGRPRATPSRHGDLEPREQILDAAAALFAQHGYAGTSTRAIAERVGVRQASLYYHFSGKDEILLELLETSVRPSLVFVDALIAHNGRHAALYALASIDVGTLLATPYNIGTLYLAHEVQQPRFDSFRAHRAELQSAYTTLAGGSDFEGACCMQLVEMVIELRRNGELAPDIASSIAVACLQVLGLPRTDLDAAVEAGEQLLTTLKTDRPGARH